MAPEEFKRHNDIRVDVQRGVHARACTGGSIAIEQSDPWTISGNLPDATPFPRHTPPRPRDAEASALADRYNNIRGPKESRHDREEAQTHASDIVAILRVITDIPSFNVAFVSQFQREHSLGIAVLRILADYFREQTSPGLILYAEYAEQIAANLPTPFRLSFLSCPPRNSSQFSPRSRTAPTTSKDLPWSTNTYRVSNNLALLHTSSRTHHASCRRLRRSLRPGQHAPHPRKRRDFDAERIPTPVIAHVPPNEFGTTPSEPRSARQISADPQPPAALTQVPLYPFPSFWTDSATGAWSFRQGSPHAITVPPQNVPLLVPFPAMSFLRENCA
jgi:hypothetical protein